MLNLGKEFHTMQDKQIIITIGREYGSLGHLIAEKVGEELELPVLDRDFFRQMSINHGVDPKFVREHDEKKRNLFITRQRRGYSNSMEDIVAEMVFDYERELAETGESLIIVGRCAEWVLRDFPNLIRIFITAAPSVRIWSGKVPSVLTFTQSGRIRRKTKL